MTPIFLLEELADFVEKKTKDIILQVRVRKGGVEDKERPAMVYKMELPNKDDRTQKIPYILLQFLNGKDDKKPQELEESIGTIRIVIATYSEDAGKGKYDVLNLISRIRSELEKVGIIGEKFALEKPLEYIVYPDNTAPYYLGEMITNWSMPTIKREMPDIWGSM